MPIAASLLLTIYNRKHLFKRTLLGYKRFGFNPDVELVMVDDVSTDGLTDLIPLAREVFARVVHVVMDKKTSIIPVYFNNPALGLNIGVKKCSAPLIIKTDPECYPLENNLQYAKDYMVGGRRAVLYGRAVFGSEWMNGQWDQNPSFLPNNEQELSNKYPGAIERVVVGATAVRGPWWFIAAFHRQHFIEIGGIDEQFLLGFAGEDDDWAERMQRGGFNREWDDRMSVLHQYHTPPQTKADPRKHEDNKNRLVASRVSGRVLANQNHDWGSDKSVVSVQVYE